MPVPELVLPNKPGFDFGIGLQHLSGMLMNQAVIPTPTPPMIAGGADHSFKVSRITSSQDLQQSLGIDVDASYGCAAFGAGASARFQFSQNQHVHSESLFMMLTATVQQADQSIDHAVLTDEAQQVRANDSPAVFAQHYGDVFARTCTSGGIFVGVLRVETFSEESVAHIESELHGSYGGFSADAKVKFEQAVRSANASAYFEIYSEGGPALHVNDPTDPGEMLDLANEWMAAMSSDPEANSRPYQWTFSPLSIAEGPPPPNDADMEHARDVLRNCARQRNALLDLVNKYAWITLKQSNYDWANAAPVAEFVAAFNAAETALDVVAAAASNAMDHPGAAQNPHYDPIVEPSPMPVARGPAAAGPGVATMEIDPLLRQALTLRVAGPHLHLPAGALAAIGTPFQGGG